MAIKLQRKSDKNLPLNVSGMLVISVWDGQFVHVFHSALERLLENKNSLYKSDKFGKGENVYQFLCEKRSGFLEILGKERRRLFRLDSIGSVRYRK